MKHIRSIILTMLTALLVLPVSASDTQAIRRNSKDSRANVEKHIIAEMYPGPDSLVITKSTGLFTTSVVNVDGRECLEVYKDSQSYDLGCQLSYEYPYVNGETYYFTFDVKGDQATISSEFLVSLFTRGIGDGHRHYGECDDFNITSEWQTITIKGTATGDDLKDGYLSRWTLILGGYEGTFYISNLQIYTLETLPLVAGDDFEYEDLWYTVLDAEEKTVKTREGFNNGPGNDYRGDLVIPETVKGSGENYKVVEIGSLSFKDNKELKSIQLPESITSIGVGAFEDCSGLTSIILPKSLTSIGSQAFMYCSSLTSIEITGPLTSIEQYVFSDCSSLSSISLPESITSIEVNAFWGCEALTTIKFPPSLDTIWMVAFENCGSLISLDFPESLKCIKEWAFRNCTSLTSITLPKSLESMGEEVFLNCWQIDSISYLAPSPIDAPDNLFVENVYKSATLSMPNATITEIQATVPWNKFEHIKAKDGSVGFGAEADEDFEYEGLWYTVIDTEARTCRTKAGEDAFSSGNYVKGDIVIPAIAVDEGIEYSVVEIGDRSFMSNQELKSIQLPESVKSIGTYAFENCIYLSSINIPTAVSSIGARAFANCWILNSIHIPESLTSIENGLFYYCLELTSVNIPNNVTSIGEGAFEVCPKISSIDIPESVTSIGGMAFYDCNGLKSINLPGSLLTIGNGVFNSGLDYSDTETVYYMASIPLDANSELFIDSVYNVATLHMPNASLADIRATTPWNLFKYIVAKDGSVGFEDPIVAGEEFEYEGIFYNVLDQTAGTCKTKDAGNVVSGNVVIPDVAYLGSNGYRVVEIGKESFAGSSYIRSLSLPATIETVGEDAFSGCERLTSLIWRGERRMPAEVVEAIGNPNLLVYVDGEQFAPEGLDHNVVVVADWVCERLVLTPGYAFSPVAGFTAKTSCMTKEFTQTTAYDGCAGWETIVLPFDATRVVSKEGNLLTPFNRVSNANRQRPFWLYEADPEGEWMAIDSIKAGVPYIISMPNNPRYNPAYNISGPVTFSNPTPQLITAETTSPYAITWNSGREFRSLWLPLAADETYDVLGLNATMDDVRDESGRLLEPGSAFCRGIIPKPLEAYVYHHDAIFEIRGLQSAVLTLTDDDGLTVMQEEGTLLLKSSEARMVEIYSADGTLLRRVSLQSGEPVYVDSLPQGVCLVAGRKVMIR